MPDPGRGERLNIGILLWAGNRYQLRLDDDAVDRVVRENPRLVRESLLYVAPMIRERLKEGVGVLGDRMTDLLARQSGFPVDMSEPRFTELESSAAMDDAVDALVQRIVRPKRHYGGSSFDPRQAIEQRLKPLLRQGRVERHHFFKSSGTGIGRAVDFFANHDANTALDVVRLAIKKADDIQNRADAEAFKVYDIRRGNDDIRFVVYCDFSQDSALEAANAAARKVIESTGALVVVDAEEAAGAMISGKR